MANQTTQVFNLLKEKIIKGEYSPSENLPEQELSSQFGVSRNTIKKALLMLEKENLVTIELNKGAKVRSYSLEEVLEYLELRAYLEGFIAKKAVLAFTDEQIEELGEILKTMKECYDNQQLLLYSQNNLLFHNTIYDVCPNKTAVELITKLKTQMSKYNTKTILISGRDSQSFAEHSAIYDAIKNRDPELAEALMIRHISNVRKTFKENYTLLF